MKKIYLTLLGVFTFALWQIGNAQTILFSEDFASGIPGTWTLINNDGLTPNSNVAQFTNAWIGAADFDNTTDTVAMSTSWYTPAGTADDWLITPAINLTTNNTLSWEAEAQDVDYPDGYEVRISTTTPTIAGFNANPPLFSIGAESGGTWTQRSVDLQAAGYSNQTVYIAWRNNSNDMFVLMVDDIAVTTPANSDLAISDVTTSGELQNTVFSSDDFIIVDYSKRTNFTADVTIENTGTDPVSVIYLTYALVDNLSGPTVGVIYGDTVNLGTPLAPGQTYTYSYAPENITSLFPSLATDGTIDFYVQLDSAANNTVFNNDDYYYGAVIAPTLSYTAPYSTSYEIADLVAGQFDFSHTTWGWKYFDNDNDNNSLSVGAFSNIDAYDGDFLVIGSVVGGSLTTGALNETMQSPELTLTAGQSYEFSIWARTGYGATGSVAAYLVDASGTTNTLLGNITLAAGDSTYQQFTFPTTPTTTKSDYMVEFRKSATGFVILDLFNMTTSVSPCSITDLTAGTQGACNPSTNQYTQQVIVTYSNPPASGSLSVNGQTFAITSSPQTVTLTGLTSNGSAVNVTANFTANTACTYTENSLFTAPAPCNVCSITDLTAGTQGACNSSTNQYTQQVIVTYSNPPASGSLSVNGQTFAITSSPQTVTLTGLTSNGSAVNVTANFTANTACTYTENSLFTAPASCLCPTINVSVSTTNVTNCATPNGTLTTTVSGGASPYSYVWNPVLPNQPNHSNLSAGTYSVTVTDANNCPGTGSGTINNATGSLNASISTFQNISCFGANDGTVSVTVTGATGAISYNWSDQGFNSTISTRNNLTPGSKTVTVSDASGCSVTLSFTIVEPSQLTATLVSTTDASCNGTNTGSVDMTVSGGTGTPTYSWTNTTQNTVDLTGVGAGSYTLTVTDANGCTDTESATINEPNAISVVVDNTSDVSCYMGNDGSIDVTVGGGTPNYTYAWTNGGGTNEDASGLSAGNYTLSVTDANGCTASSTQVTIANATMLDGTTSSTVETSSGAADGTATVVATGGNGSYTYLWSDNAAQTTATATGLSAGTYTVTITDGNGCTNTETVVVDLGNSINSVVMQSLQIFPNPTNKNVTISFNVAQSMETTISIFNTLGKVVYSKSNNVVNNFSTTIDVSTFAAGIYIVEVSNGNGKAVKKLTVNK